jgi:hypothetical protein
MEELNLVRQDLEHERYEGLDKRGTAWCSCLPIQVITRNLHVFVGSGKKSMSHRPAVTSKIDLALSSSDYTQMGIVTA